MQREYAEAYIASLVCCRPDGERKRSVRVVCVISIYLLGAPHGLCVFCVVRARNKQFNQLTNKFRTDSRDPWRLKKQQNNHPNYSSLEPISVKWRTVSTSFINCSCVGK